MRGDTGGGDGSDIYGNDTTTEGQEVEVGIAKSKYERYRMDSKCNIDCPLSLKVSGLVVQVEKRKFRRKGKSEGV